jgi:hypothetical protein
MYTRQRLVTPTQSRASAVPTRALFSTPLEALSERARQWREDQESQRRVRALARASSARTHRRPSSWRVSQTAWHPTEPTRSSLLPTTPTSWAELPWTQYLRPARSGALHEPTRGIRQREAAWGAPHWVGAPRIGARAHPRARAAIGLLRAGHVWWCRLHDLPPLRRRRPPWITDGLEPELLGAGKACRERPRGPLRRDRCPHCGHRGRRAGER